MSPTDTQSDPNLAPKTVGAGGLFVFLEYFGPLGQAKSAANMCIPSLWARLGRTQGDTICIKREIRRLYAQSDPKVSPKWTQSQLHMPKVPPK